MYKEKVQSFLEENIGECFYELKIRKDFLNDTKSTVHKLHDWYV